MNKLRLVGFYDRLGQSLLGQQNLPDSISADALDIEPHIIDYLRKGVCVVGRGGVMPDYLNPTPDFRLGMDLFTDGVCEWPQYLVHYVAKYHLRLPSEFIAHMIANNWVVPPVSFHEVDSKIVYV